MIRESAEAKRGNAGRFGSARDRGWWPWAAHWQFGSARTDRKV